jgi:hypothetical protein
VRKSGDVGCPEGKTTKWYTVVRRGGRETTGRTVMISRVGRLDSESSDESLAKEQIVFQLIHKAEHLRYIAVKSQNTARYFNRYNIDDGSAS